MMETEDISLYKRIGGHEGIAKLLRYFYADVRQHEVLGPIFNARIHDWPMHLAKIGEFWALQTGGPSLYRGGFGAAHLGLDIQPEHFGHWLSLWDYNCQRNLTDPEAGEMSALAHEFGRRLNRLVQMQRGAQTFDPFQIKPGLSDMIRGAKDKAGE